MKRLICKRCGSIKRLQKYISEKDKAPRVYYGGRCYYCGVVSYSFFRGHVELCSCYVPDNSRFDLKVRAEIALM